VSSDRKLTLQLIVHLNIFHMKKGYIIGLVAAAAVGAVAGLLLAPEKGKDLRKKISDKGIDLTNKMKETFKNGKEKFNAKKEEMFEV
jgi:gas vesicle protein